MFEKFDDVFNTLYEVIQDQDASADLSVHCQCGICDTCTEIKICGRTIFYDTSRLRLEQANNTNEQEGGFSSEAQIHYYTLSGKKVPLKLILKSRHKIEEFVDAERRADMIRSLSNIARSKVTTLRDCVVQASLTSTDLSSFSYKSILCLRDHLKFEGASIFILDPQTHNLELVATTGITKISSGMLSKKDIFYTEDGKSYVSRSFKERIDIQENDPSGLKHNTFGESVDNIFNRYFIPIRLRIEKNYGGLKRQPEPVFGVVRIVNIRKNGIESTLSSTDLELLKYFCEFMYILGRLYRKASDPFGVMERATHGFINDLAVLNGRLGLYRLSSKNILPETVRAVLKSSDGYLSDSARRNLEVAMHRQEAEYQQFEKVLFSVLDYMSSQLHAILDAHDFSVGNTSPEANALVERPFEDAFARLLESASFIAESHIRRVPAIRFFHDGSGGVEARYLPALSIPSDALYLVFRNLVENSIKYCDPNSTPTIEINWTVDGGFTIFRVSDNGIGINEEEEQNLFNQGFRGRNAVLLATRGNGIGLEYARQTVQLYDGDLTYIGKSSGSSGAIFEVRIPVAAT